MKSLRIVAALALAVCAVPQFASAVPVAVDFTIDPVQSNIQFDLVTDLGKGPLSSVGQGKFIATSDGKLANGNVTEGEITSYSGTIKTIVSGNSIEFKAGSSIDAWLSDNGGGWAPISGGGPQSTFVDYLTNPALRSSADYGWNLGGAVFAAFRNFVFGATSGVLPMPGGVVAGSFSSTQSLDIASGEASYADIVGGAFTAPGSFDLTGASLANAAANGTVTSVGNVLTLTMPIKITQAVDISGTPVDLVAYGTLVATATAFVPEPSSIILASAGLGMLVMVGLRRRK